MRKCCPWLENYPLSLGKGSIHKHTHKNVSGEADFRDVGHMTWAFTGNWNVTESRLFLKFSMIQLYQTGFIVLRTIMEWPAKLAYRFIYLLTIFNSTINILGFLVLCVFFLKIPLSKIFHSPSCHRNLLVWIPIMDCTMEYKSIVNDGVCVKGF